MTVVPLRWAGVAIVAALGFGAAAGQALELKLPPVEAENGGKVSFVAACDRIDELPFAKAGEDVNRIPLARYNVYYRTEDIKPNRILRFIGYRFYLLPRANGGEVTECLIKGTPDGSFRPQLANVTFYVESDQGQDPGSAKLPILSFRPPVYLAVAPWSEPQEVEIGGEREIPVPLQNLTEWPVRVEVEDPPGRKEIWRRADLVVAGKNLLEPIEIPAGGMKDRLAVKLAPHAGKALLRALFSRTSQGDPETVTFSLKYRAQLGVRDVPDEVLPVAIPVRFVPFALYFPIALTLGTLFGSLIPWAFGQRKRADWLRAFGASLLTAFLAWGIAIILVQNKSEFKLLNFTLDPFQLLPTALIGAVLGLLGFKSLETVKRLIPGLGKAPPPAKAGQDPSGAGRKE